MNKNLLKFLVKHGVDINKVVYSLKFLVLFDYSSFIIGKFKLDTQLLSDGIRDVLSKIYFNVLYYFIMNYYYTE